MSDPSQHVQALLTLGDCAYLLDGQRFPLPPILRRYQKMEAAIKRANEHLMNLQLHIPQACIPGHESFIDDHVTPAMTELAACLD